MAVTARASLFNQWKAYPVWQKKKKSPSISIIELDAKRTRGTWKRGESPSPRYSIFPSEMRWIDTKVPKRKLTEHAIEGSRTLLKLRNVTHRHKNKWVNIWISNSTLKCLFQCFVTCLAAHSYRRGNEETWVENSAVESNEQAFIGGKQFLQIMKLQNDMEHARALCSRIQSYMVKSLIFSELVEISKSFLARVKT